MDDKDSVVMCEYSDTKKVTVDDFLKQCLKEMLLADNDTCHLQGEIDNPDGSKTHIKFDLVLVELKEG